MPLGILTLHAGSTSSKIIYCFGALWIFGAAMAAIAGVSLLWKGTALDRMWTLNKPAHAALSPIASIFGPLFLLLSATLVLTATGWLRRKTWGYWLAVAILTTQVIGDIVNTVRGDFLRGVSGIVIASTLLILVRTRAVREQFL
jgi:hypothetical protein